MIFSQEEQQQSLEAIEFPNIGTEGNATGTEGNATGTEGNATGTEGNATGTEGNATGTGTGTEGNATGTGTGTEGNATGTAIQSSSNKAIKNSKLIKSSEPNDFSLPLEQKQKKFVDESIGQDFEENKYFANNLSNEMAHSIKVYNQKGKIFLKNGEYDEALASFDISLNIMPSAEGFYGKGNVLFKQGKYDDAIKAYNEALKYENSNTNLYFSKGEVLFKQGKYDDAIKAYNEALKYDPVNSTIYYKKGNIFQLQQLTFNDSLKEYNKAILIDNSNSNYYFSKGEVLFKQGKYDEALKVYRKSIALNNNNIESYFGLGNVLFKQGKYDEALKAYIAALKKVTIKQPKDIKKYISILIDRGAELNKVAELNTSDKNRILQIALTYINKAIEFNPYNSKAFFEKGDILFKQGNYADALDAYINGIEFKPKPTAADVWRLTNLGGKLNVSNNLTMAYYYFTNAIVFNKNSTDAYYGLGNVLFKQGDYNESIKAFDKALTIDPNYVAAYHEQGHSLFKNGEYSKALHIYEIAVNKDPLDKYDEKIFVIQGKELNRLNNTNMSLIYLNKAIELNKDNSNAFFEKGNTLFSQNNLGEALKAYDKSIAIDKNKDVLKSIVYFSKGNVLFQLAQYTGALNAYKNALSGASAEEQVKIYIAINKTQKMLNKIKMEKINNTINTPPI
jgi:tetratricopeptide (TPR) repeat protein